MKYTKPTGLFDIIPAPSSEEWRRSHLWQHVESTIRQTTSTYGFQEIRTPIFERTEVFTRSVGETSDIVSKEMYVFEDKGERSMSLRPEGTAPVMRAFAENNFQSSGSLHKLYYIGPMFRYDRPQKGRYRQHHQFGAEAIGLHTPEQDVEVIDMLHTLYVRLGMKKLNITINSLGTTETRTNFRQALIDYLIPLKEQLSEDSQRRLESNPLRILDSKDEADRKIVKNAPSILDFLDSESQDYFQTVRSYLDSLKIPYTVDPHLVRGLDYYNHTVFEVLSGELGAQNSIGGGGRYDGLLKQLGGPDLPAMGFGAGMERMIQVMLAQNCAVPSPYAPLLFLIPLGDVARTTVFELTHKLRQSGAPVQMDFSGKKLGKVMQYADQINAQFIAVIGDEEIASKEVTIKEMATGEEKKVPFDTLSRIMSVQTRSEEYMNLVHEMEKPFTDKEEANFFLSKVRTALEETQKATEALHEKVQKFKRDMENE